MQSGALFIQVDGTGVILTFMLIGVGILLVILYVSSSGLITSVWEESYFSEIYVVSRFPLSLGAWGRLRYFIVAFHVPSI